MKQMYYRYVLNLYTAGFVQLTSSTCTYSISVGLVAVSDLESKLMRRLPHPASAIRPVYQKDSSVSSQFLSLQQAASQLSPSPQGLV